MAQSNFWCTFWSHLAQTVLVWSLRIKKIQYNIFWFSEMSARSNFMKLAKISKNLKYYVVFLEFQFPKRSQIIPNLISLVSLNVKFYKFGSSNQNLCFLKIFIVAYFPVVAHCASFSKRLSQGSMKMYAS